MNRVFKVRDLIAGLLDIGANLDDELVVQDDQDGYRLFDFSIDFVSNVQNLNGELVKEIRFVINQD